MAKQIPLLITLGFFLGVVFLSLQKNATSDAYSQSQKVSRSTHGGARSSGQEGPASTTEFSALPRGIRTPQGLTFLTEGAIKGRGTAATITNRSEAKTVGHYRIPPSVASLGDEALRERLPKDVLARLVNYEEQLSNFDPEHRRYFCWGPNTQPEIIEAFHRVEASAGLSPGRVRTLAFQFLGSGHWSQTATNGSGVGNQGQPVTVTWSISPDNTTVPSGDNDPAGPSDFIAWLDGIYPGTITSDLTQRAWFPILQEAMDDLAAQAGLNLVYEPNDDGVPFTSSFSGRGILGTRGDIRLSGRDIDGDFGVLGFAFSPNFGDVVLDTTDAFFNNTNNNSIRLINTITHEIGHALGLGHVCPITQTKLMEPFLSTQFRGTQFDETYSLQRQYGDSLESHSGITQNDSVGSATPLTLTNDTFNTWRFLSIDDSSDVDYLSFSAIAGENITVRVLPADSAIGSYNEGAQNADGCSAGTLFNPLTQQDLTLEILATDGATVIAVANTQPLGATEELIAIPLPTTGTYYLRINGDTADSSQLYELQAEITSAPPSPLLEVTSTRLIDESNSGANGVADPGETLVYGVTVTNIGNLAASNLSATLSGPSGFVPFSATDGEASLALSASTELQFVFSPGGNCGDIMNLSLMVSDDSGYFDTLSFPLSLGVISETLLIDENFDSSVTLPSGWTLATDPGASSWDVISSTNFLTPSDTPPNSIFSAGVTSRSDSLLISPAGVIESNNAILSFQHFYDLESGSDGAVLEASLDSGAWFDLLTSAATVTEGGYDGVISGGQLARRASITGRSAWTGFSPGFITTVIELPSSWTGQSLQLRWLLSHNLNNNAGTGWFVDSISLSGAIDSSCDPFRPTVTLSTTGTTLIEGDNSSNVDLTLSTSLPLASELTVNPLISGAGSLDDLVNPPSFTLPSATTSTAATISAVSDSLNEGAEQITFTLSSSDPDFAAGTPSVANLIIDESFSSWAASFGLTAPDPFDDFDNDGQLSVVEYIYNTNPNDQDAVPLFQYVGDNTLFSLITPPPVPRPDINVEGETSADLSQWSSDGVTENSNGYSIPTSADLGFLRLKITLGDPPSDDE